ncbi:hypothetical protein AMP9_4137 [plant metagenome]|uniref:Uncharacterized protein n=1 Tax=plant metagenome TaxID=1297885 RepID=A0A484PB30_9ZZZZ
MFDKAVSEGFMVFGDLLKSLSIYAATLIIAIPAGHRPVTPTPEAPAGEGGESIQRGKASLGSTLTNEGPVSLSIGKTY